MFTLLIHKRREGGNMDLRLPPKLLIIEQENFTLVLDSIPEHLLALTSYMNFSILKVKITTLNIGELLTPSGLAYFHQNGVSTYSP